MNPKHYSILSTLGRQHRDESGKYTFALVYEEISRYNIWQQSNNPIYEINKPGGNYKVPGYNRIDIKADRVHSDCTFGGLVTDPDNGNTLLYGCPGGTNWFFSIGYTGKHSDYTLIPSNDTNVKEVSLWVKLTVFKGLLTCNPLPAPFIKYSLIITPILFLDF